MVVDERAWGWAYQGTAALALLIALLLPSARSAVPHGLRGHYALLQGLTLIGAVVGAKLAMLAGDLGWPATTVELEHVLFSGKSLTGGLLGGFLAAELAKPVLNWREPPNDWFACKLLLSIAIGRLGCVLAGCCRGLPTSSALSLTYSDDVPRVPIAPLEVVFHAGLFALFLRAQRNSELRGKLFALYLLVYGIFRFATEPLRETPKQLAGFSVYQILALALVGAGAWSLFRKFPIAMSERTE